mmetsp:Transcript_69041/g.114757  ORF Transcript_69041/g.114757 Transcript_69041/m.114757 type:complete len:221 (-) Transcript_69041:389-1051(-)|eukprot:CAMPEP_0119313432 /NCGR_PEP_ID=MMETSP1333-20130426/29101_1 /TAXON_ID=418940 /ORGANISM="Scyphosphaera apsteinii, Strain RCC1455" /LENGTH=220 /DNA_ID=CAMNT_0007318271 /DNA_START=52 /DNA_END=714 /DNA_ORIENTATION=+
MSIRKKTKPTAWQRRKARAQARSTEPDAKLGTESEMHKMNQICSQAKAASFSARERFRLKQPSEPGDRELVAIYQNARKAVHVCQAKYAATKKAAQLKSRTKGGERIPTISSREHLSDKAAVGYAAAPVLPSRMKLEESQAGLMTAEALGVTPSERRLAKKAAKRARAGELRAQENVRKKHARFLAAQTHRKGDAPYATNKGAGGTTSQRFGAKRAHPLS